MPAAPVTPGEFASLMARLGPWGAGRPVAVAVSGGADSLCLAWLASRWSETHALIVDHALRPDSATEAATAATTLARFGVPSRILRLDDLSPGPALAERARAARYSALLAACARLGLSDLLIGHHAGDQAETVLMRRLSASGPDGLAGMSPLSTRTSCRLLRPLLDLPPDRLRATLHAAGLPWTEDPSNRNPSALRTRLRQRLATSGESPGLLAAAHAHAHRRQVADTETAFVLARIATLRPDGIALLLPGPWPPRALASVLRMVAGRTYLPDARAVSRLAATPRAATLGGARLLPAGRLGPGWLVLREAAAMPPPTPATSGAVWDNRFRLLGEGDPTLTLGALGPDAAPSSRDGLPAAARATLPALRDGARVVCIPHETPGSDWHARVVFDPPMPACAAPFDACARQG